MSTVTHLLIENNVGAPDVSQLEVIQVVVSRNLVAIDQTRQLYLWEFQASLRNSLRVIRSLST